MTTLTERIRADQIGIAASQRDYPPAVHAMGTDDGTWWNVTLSRPGQRDITLPFYMGSAYFTMNHKTGARQPQSPDARQVLSALLSDAAGLNDYGMSEWVAEYFPDDDRLGARIYQAVSDQGARLRRFLGGEYDAYLWETADA